MTSVQPSSSALLSENLSGDTIHSSTSYFPGLDGLRLFSAYGVVLTHVAFQTGHSRHNIFDLLLGRLDLAVAVFFALSGFLLWKPYPTKIYALINGMDYRNDRRENHSPGLKNSKFRLFSSVILRYYLHRILRIVPAYWVVAACAFFLLPSLHFSSAQVIWANFGLYQIYRPLDLVDGLTQIWSLDVEMSFYLILPAIAWALSRFHSFMLRIVLLGGSFIASLLWWSAPLGANHNGFDLHNTLPGYWCWFSIGLILAELYTYLQSSTASHRLKKSMYFCSKIHITLPFCAIAYALVISPLGGPPGFFTPTIGQRMLRLIIGSVIAYLLISRQIFLQLENQEAHHADNSLIYNLSQHKKFSAIFSLSNPFISALGKWAYGIFLWHLLLLIAIMSLNYIFPFHGHFLLLAISTLLLSTLFGGLSYIFVEYPCACWARKIEQSVIR